MDLISTLVFFCSLQSQKVSPAGMWSEQEVFANFWFAYLHTVFMMLSMWFHFKLLYSWVRKQFLTEKIKQKKKTIQGLLGAFLTFKNPWFRQVVLHFHSILKLCIIFSFLTPRYSYKGSQVRAVQFKWTSGHSEELKAVLLSKERAYTSNCCSSPCLIISCAYLLSGYEQ